LEQVAVDNPPGVSWSCAGSVAMTNGSSSPASSGVVSSALPYSFPQRFGLAFEEEARRFGGVVMIAN